MFPPLDESIDSHMFKKARLVQLHVENLAPDSFLEEAVEKSCGDTNYFDQEKFGIQKEAFVRKAH